MIEGVDVSHHQPPGSCDWTAAAHAGLRFAYVKCTAGREDSAPYLDPACVSHLDAIRKVEIVHSDRRVGEPCRKIIPGLYHYAHPNNRAAEGMSPSDGGVVEARWFAKHVRSLGASDCLPPVLDIEERVSAWGREEMAVFVVAFVEALQRDTGLQAAVYAGPNFWAEQMPADFAAKLHDRGVALWLARYTPEPDPTKIIPGWPYTMWQWSGGGSTAYAEPWPGLPHPIDRNRYRGGEAEFQALIGGGS